MTRKELIKKVSLAAMVAFYLFAGINHFINPEFYYPLIPPAFKYITEINTLSGIAEIGLAIGLIFNNTRKASVYLIIAMLIAFIPSHWFFIQEGSCLDELCVSEWFGWARLVVVHPLLILWAFSQRSVTLP